jgi:hypothetical protein
MLKSVWPAGDRGSGMLLLVVMTGILLRVLLWWWGGSLSGDEAMLALTIGARHVRELSLPPLYDQSAPLLFMVLTKLVTVALGVSELALRLPPLLGGCLALALYAITVRKLAGERIAILACLLLALSATPVHYAVIFKPYSVDLLVAVLALRAGHDSLERSGAKADSLLLALWMVGPWVSAASVFVLCGITVVLVMHRSRVAGVRRAWSIMLIGLAGGGSFLLAYHLVYSVTAASSYMRAFWAGAYPGFGNGDAILRSILAVGGIAWGIFSVVPVADLLGPQYPLLPLVMALMLIVLVIIAGVLGMARLIRTGRFWLAMLAVMPAVVMGAAAVAQLYPLVPRLMLCVLPGWLLCIAVEVDHCVGRLAAAFEWERFESGIKAVGFLCLAGIVGLQGLAESSRWSEARMLTRWARSGTDPVYVFVRGIPQFLFYSTDWSHPDAARVEYLHGLSRAGAPFFENGESPPPVPAVLHQPFWTGGDSLLLGAPDGLFFRAGFGWNASSVWGKWLRGETARIGHGGRSSIALLALHNIDAGGTHLLRAMEQEGWDCRPVIARDGDFAAQCSRSDDTPSTPDL